MPGGALSARGRAVRVAALAVLAALLLAGTLLGSDDDFPVGPFRMYATADDPDGTVLSTTLRAVLADGRPVEVTDGDVGMRRAEYEGQLPALVSRPEVLARLAAVHGRRHPDGPAWVELQVVQRAYRLVGGAPAGETEQVLARWRAS